MMDLQVHKKVGCQGGFSLVELAIVMIIVGLLSIPLLERLRVYQVKEKIDNTSIAFTNVNAALGDFYIKNGRYPCPSDRNISFGDTSDDVPNGHARGREDCTVIESLSPGTCKNGGGICRVAGTYKNKDTGVIENALIGGIPYADLAIPYIEMLDGYNNPITYAVTEAYVNEERMGELNKTGTLTVRQVDINPDTGVRTEKDVKEVFFVLVSSGQNRKGSYNLNGVAEPCTPGEDDFENCNNDGIFLNKSIFDAEGGEYFDDRIVSVTWNPSSIWALSDVTTGAIYNTNPGTVGIGTKTPDTTVKLDIIGDLKAEDTRSVKFCDSRGENCLETKTIAGEGIKCPEGQFLNGIANNKPLCTAISIDVEPKNCPPGQFITKILTNGSIVCATPNL